MKVGAGFTLVEIIITLVVMVILMTLGTVAVTSLQGQARDKERLSDVEAIARGLEARYNNGNPRATEATGMTDKGIYSGVNEIFHAGGYDRSTFTPTLITGGYYTDLFPGTTVANYQSPSEDEAFVIICAYACQPAGNTTQINAAFNNKDVYVYEPVDTGGNVCCCGDCYKFNLYWKDESGTVQKVTSKHQ